MRSLSISIGVEVGQLQLAVGDGAEQATERPVGRSKALGTPGSRTRPMVVDLPRRDASANNAHPFDPTSGGRFRRRPGDGCGDQLGRGWGRRRHQDEYGRLARVVARLGSVKVRVSGLAAAVRPVRKAPRPPRHRWCRQPAQRVAGVVVADAVSEFRRGQISLPGSAVNPGMRRFTLGGSDRGERVRRDPLAACHDTWSLRGRPLRRPCWPARRGSRPGSTSDGDRALRIGRVYSTHQSPRVIRYAVRCHDSRTGHASSVCQPRCFLQLTEYREAECRAREVIRSVRRSRAEPCVRSAHPRERPTGSR